MRANDTGPGAGRLRLGQNGMDADVAASTAQSAKIHVVRCNFELLGV
jgi:hypothetical protein